MHSIKIISLSLALLFSCSSFSSAPAPARIAQPDNDELKIQEIPLIPIKKAVLQLTQHTKITQNFLKRHPTFDKKLIQDKHQTECDINNLIAHESQALQHIDERAQNGEDVSAQKQQLQALHNQLDEHQNKDHILLEQARVNNKSDEVRRLDRAQKNLYWFQAVFLRAEKEEEKIKHEEEKIKMQMQINQLQEKLKQYEPGFQPQMEEQIEGKPNQMPLVPGGAK